MNSKKYIEMEWQGDKKKVYEIVNKKDLSEWRLKVSVALAQYFNVISIIFILLLLQKKKEEEEIFISINTIV